MVWRLGFRPEDIVIDTAAYHLVRAGLVFHEALQQRGATVIPTGPGNSDLQAQVMRDLRVTGYVGFPRFLVTILEKAKEQGYRFPADIPLRLALWMGEKELRKMVEQEYGFDTRQYYGIAHDGMPAYECCQKNGLHFDEDFIIEIVDPNTGKQLGPGEVGEVVLTSLENYVLPIIRFGSGDLSYYTDEPCPCGLTSHRLVEIVGRVGEAVKARGMFIHPDEVDLVASYFPEVSRVQLVVTIVGIRDEIEANLELKDEVVDRDKLAESLQNAFRDRCQLKIDRVKFVAKGTIPEDEKSIVDKRGAHRV